MLSLRFLCPGILLVWLIAGCQPANTYVEPPPPEVTVAPPLQKAVTSYVHYTGTTHAVAKVDVRARVRGFLKKRFFEEGSIVKEGQLLLVIDEEPFTVQLDQARARLAEAEATLQKAEESRRPEKSPGRSSASTGPSLYFPRSTSCAVRICSAARPRHAKTLKRPRPLARKMRPRLRPTWRISNNWKPITRSTFYRRGPASRRP